MTTLLNLHARDHPDSGPSAALRSSEEPSRSSAPPSPIRDRAGSSFTALTRSIHEMGLMRRRYGYYWAKLIGAVLILAAWVVGFIWIGDSWWQLANAGVLAVVMTQIAFLGHDAAHRQIFKSGRWNDWVSLIIANLLVGISYGWWQSKHNRHHANPNKVGADPDIALTAIALTPAQATRHRSRLMRWLVAHQGWYFFPILLLEGLSLHHDGDPPRHQPGQDPASLGRDQLHHLPTRRIRCSGLPRASPGESGRVPRLCSWPSSACTWAHHSRPTTSACRWCRPS